MTSVTVEEIRHIVEVAGAQTVVTETPLVSVVELPGQVSIRTASIARVFVASATASPEQQAAAHFVCDGTADDVEIQAALAEIDAIGGGDLVLSEGIFSIADPIALGGINFLRLRGSGRNQTALVLANGANCNVFNVASPITNCTFSDFTLNGNKTNQVDQAARDDLCGFLFEDGVSSADIGFANIIATNFRHGAALRLNGITHLSVHNVIAHSNGVGGAAFSCDGIFAGSITYGVFSHIQSYSNTDTGLAMDGCEHCAVSNAIAVDNDSQGFAMGQGSGYITYASCHAYANGIGWKLAKFGGSLTHNAYMAGCVARANTGAGLDLTDHVGLSWEGGTIVNNGSPITLGAGNSGISVRGAIGFVTEARGNAQILDNTTSIDVTHGLGATPATRDIQVTPVSTLASAARFWISNAGATTFRINIDADPNATVTFAWQAHILFVA